jgi:hypothetical protein
MSLEAGGNDGLRSYLAEINATSLLSASKDRELRRAG